MFRRLAPGLKGLGYGIIAVPTMMTFYYTVIMAWALFYLFMVKQIQKRLLNFTHKFKQGISIDIALAELSVFSLSRLCNFQLLHQI